MRNEQIDQKEKSWLDCYETAGNDIFLKVKYFQEMVAKEEKEKSLLFRRPLLSASGPRVTIQDPYTDKPKEMIMVGSNSYFGLTTHPQVVEASIEAAKKYGYGTGSVSLLSGTTDLHIQLEKKIAKFYKCDDAILYPTGYSANVGVITALMREKDTVINDMFNHASIFDGSRMSGAEIKVFAHSNMTHLEKLLRTTKEEKPDSGILVITDGVFSMDGDAAQLGKIYNLCRQYDAKLMTDEAHSLGVIGANGRGTPEEFGLDGKVDIISGTLSKITGAIGGYAVGSKALIDYLRFYSRSYFFSTSIPAPVIAGLIEIFNILETDSSYRTQLWSNINYVVKHLKEAGFKMGNIQSAIIPVIIGDEDKLKAMSRELHQKGIFINYVAFPAVAKKRCRFRMSLMSQNTKEDLDYVVSCLIELGKKYKII